MDNHYRLFLSETGRVRQWVAVFFFFFFFFFFFLSRTKFPARTKWPTFVNTHTHTYRESERKREREREREREIYTILHFFVFKHLPYSIIECIKLTLSGLDGSVGCAVRLETRRSRVQPPPGSATFFRGDWPWNIFYGHSLPSADSRRAVVSFWRKNVHNTG